MFRLILGLLVIALFVVLSLSSPVGSKIGWLYLLNATLCFLGCLFVILRELKVIPVREKDLLTQYELKIQALKAGIILAAVSSSALSIMTMHMIGY